MQSLHRNNIPVGSSCGGEGICSKCALNIISGLENLSEKSEPENQLSIKFGFSKDQRISCQTQVYGDVIIDADYW